MAATDSGPPVVLVGRPNVGKSTLFNRITGRRRSIVAPIAGTTRDMLEAPATWAGRNFTLIDTGGLFGATTDPLHDKVAAQGLKALDRAQVVVFTVDGREGLVPGDHEIARRLHALGRPVVLSVNKTDDRSARARVPEFHELGFSPVIEIAAEHGDGVAELLDAVVERLPKSSRPAGGPAPGDEPDAAQAETAIAIIGRPNVGKSSLVNRLVREERVLVSEMPGTTRDTVDVVMRWHGRTLRLVDTAGIRRPGRVAQAGQVESVSVTLAKRAIERADVAVLVVDATEGAGDREGAIAGEADAAGCGIVIAVNKWDLVKGRGEAFVKAFDDRLRFQLKFLDYAPLVRISALTGERTGRLLEVIDQVAQTRQRRIPTGELNRFLAAVTEAHPPVSPGRHEVRILYAAQVGVAPPSFVLFTNVAASLHFSYERFLVNRLRESFGFEGTPIRLAVRRRGRERPAGGAGRRKKKSRRS
jgi:GTP-binding protein